MSDVDTLVNAMAGLTAALEQSRRAGAYAPPAPAAPDPFAQAAAQVLQQNPGASLEDVMSALGGQPQATPAASAAPDQVAELRAEVAQLREATTAMHADLLRIGQAMLAMANVGAQGSAQEPAGPSPDLGEGLDPVEPHSGAQGGMNGTALD